MEARLQRRVQRYGWDRASTSYDAYWSRQLEPAQRRLLEMADLRPGERVLDVACGTGLNFELLQRAVDGTGRIVGMDTHPHIQLFRRRDDLFQETLVIGAEIFAPNTLVAAQGVTQSIHIIAIVCPGQTGHDGMQKLRTLVLARLSKPSSSLFTNCVRIIVYRFLAAQHMQLERRHARNIKPQAKPPLCCWTGPGRS